MIDHDRRFAIWMAVAVVTTRAPPASADALQLEDVVTATLSHNVDVQRAAIERDAARAELQAAAAPFDSSVNLSASADRLYQFADPSSASAEAPASSGAIPSYELSLGAGWTKLFRNGIVLAPSVTTTQTRVLSDPRIDVARASARIALTVPLLRDRGGMISAAPERAARATAAASALDETQARASGVVQAATAYWGYRAARDRLAVFTASEGRAERTATEIAALSRANERTRADLTEARGHLASRRAQRIAVEADVVASWEELALVTGMAHTEIQAEAATELPAAGAAPPEELAARAVPQRADLTAARRRADAAAEALAAARNELQARLDLQLSAGYTARIDGAGPADLLDPLVRQIPGIEAGVQLRLELPVGRDGATGRAAQRSAAYRREQLLIADLERRIAIRAAAALANAKIHRAALIESEAAVQLLEQTVNDEKAKFRAGASTLLAVIQAEEALTESLLEEIAGRLAFAIAVAQLRFETGALVPPRSVAEMVTLLRVFP